MKTRDQILEQLRKAGETGISGQVLAEALHISRTAVWKAVRSLGAEGYEIKGTQNRGYVLRRDRDPLSAVELKTLLPGLEIAVLPTVDSTNNEAKRRIAAGFDKPLLVTAEEQTAGRGRQGKAFYSPLGTGIYFTLVIHPGVPVQDAVSVTTMSSVAVCRAIRRLTDLKPEIKWVNDLYWKGKKCCGILVEAVSDFETGITASLLIGVGVNLTTKEFPSDLPNATSLGIAGVSRNRLIVEIVRELLSETADLRSRAYLEDYRAWSCVLGKRIDYYRDGEKKTATAVEIADNGGLVVEDETGRRTTLESGEITVRIQ